MKITKSVEFCIWALIICVLFIGQYRLHGVVFENADYYAQAVRVRDILTNHTWFGGMLRSADYPFGEPLTGARGADLFWLICSIPLYWYTDIIHKVLITGMISVAVSALLALLFFVGRTDGILSQPVRTVAIVILIMQWSIHSDFDFAASSSLLIFPITAIICEWWNYSRYKNPLPIALIGVFLSLMAWFGPQGLLSAYALALALIISWCFRKVETDDLLVMLGIFAGLLTLFWLLDLPAGGFKTILFNRLSVFHVVLSVMLFGIVGVCLYLPLYTEVRRFSAFLFLISVAAIIGYYCFGNKIIAALPHTDNALNTILRAELQKTIYRKWIVYIYPLIGFLMGYILLKMTRFESLVMMPLCALVGLILLMFYNLTAVAACVVTAFLISVLFLQMLYEKKLHISPPFTICCSVLAGIGVIGMFFLPSSEEKYGNKKVTSELLRDINVLAELSPGTVLSDSLYGYPILWGAQHNVVGTTNPLNRQGIVNTHVIWMSENISDVWKLLNKHKVDYVFLPENYDKDYFKMSPENEKRFYMRVLTDNNLPKWLIPLRKTNIFSGFLYKVLRNRDSEIRDEVKREEQERLERVRAAEKMANDFGFMLRP